MKKLFLFSALFLTTMATNALCMEYEDAESKPYLNFDEILEPKIDPKLETMTAMNFINYAADCLKINVNFPKELENKNLEISSYVKTAFDDYRKNSQTYNPLMGNTLLVLLEEILAQINYFTIKNDDVYCITALDLF